MARIDSATTTSLEPSAATVSPTNVKQRGKDSTVDDAPRQSTAKDIQPAEVKKKYRHVTAIHKTTRPSALSHDTQAAPSFIGFRNLMVIFLVVGNLRLIIENIQKYGNLICLTCHDWRRQDVVLGLLLYFLIPCSLFIAYLIELYAATKATQNRAVAMKRSGVNGPTEDQQTKFRYRWRIIRSVHAVNATAALIFTSWAVYYHIHHPLIGTATEIHVIIVYMKVASYALTNRDLRHAYLHPATGDLSSMPEIYASCPYPQNITMENLTYFWWAPTLVYQPVYPRTKEIRWMFVFKRLGEMVCLGVFIWFCAAQYASPVLWNSLDKMHSLNFLAILERLLKLSTISLVVWLAGFFAIFQSALNALAEVMRFGDRAFYDDWWNSAGLGDYWRLWNKPVYQFMKRHVYIPLVGRGYSIGHGSIAVFLVSAILHELAVGVPTHNIIGVAFFGMLFQLPLIAITRPFQKMQSPTGKLIGNVIFWVSFTVFGQPFAALLYFYAWQAKYGSVSKRMATTYGTMPASA